MIEVLLSLRVNALQIAPELRKNLVYELIRNDIFNIEASERFDFIVQMLDFSNQSLKHAITSLVSVVSSTLRGVEYLTFGGKFIVIEKIVRVSLKVDWLSNRSDCVLVDLEGSGERKCDAEILFGDSSEVFDQRVCDSCARRAWHDQLGYLPRQVVNDL